MGESKQWFKESCRHYKYAQTVETRGYKQSRGLQVKRDKCRLCGEVRETVMHLLGGCKVMAARKYTKKHINALTILAKEWGRQEGIIGQESMVQGKVGMRKNN